MRIATILPIAVLFLLAITLLLLAPSAQSPSAEAQSVQEQALWSPYWTVEPGFTSLLTMKNNRKAEVVRVEVSLYFANGEEYYLPALHLEPRQTVVINLNRAYENLPPSLRARVGTEGAAEVSFTAPNASAVMGGISVTNPEQGVAWNFRLYPRAPALPYAPLTGVFWFYDSQSDGFVAMQNVSGETIQVTPRLYVGGAAHTLPPVRLWPEQTHRLQLGQALRDLGLTGIRVGGVELAYEGPSEALIAHGALSNGRGFSSEITFLRRATAAEEQSFSVRTPRFAIGPADPRLGLPSPTSFDPSLALANFGETPLPVKLLVGFRGADGSREIELSVLLDARESRVMRLADELRGVVPSGTHWASLEVSYASREAQLAAGLTSVSPDGRRSVGAVLNHVEGSVAEGWYWQVDVDSTTLLGILNADIEEATVQVWLDYTSDSSTSRYDLPETVIPGRGTILIDLSQFVGSDLPDTDGDVIPSGVTFGGYRVRKVGGRMNRRLTTEALLINRRAKTYLPLYNTCCGSNFVELLPSSVSGPVGSSAQLQFLLQNSCSGFVDDVTAFASYSSDDSNIAGVNSVGTVSLNNPGSTTVRASINSDVPQPGCDSGEQPPFEGGGGGGIVCCGCFPITLRDSTSVTVSTPQLSLACPATVTRGQTAQCTASVTNVGSGATVTFTSWRFTDGTSTVNRSCTNCPATWSGTMVKGGTIRVTARVNNTDLPAATRNITVNPRNWHTNPASATQVPNGTIVPPLPVPPQPDVPDPGDSGLGVSEEQTGNLAFASSLISSGPNQGYAYYATQPTFSPLFFRYAINPDLENSGSVFSQHQCGNYDPDTNPGGFISWGNLFTQTRRHEFNSTVQSHHAFYANAINLSTNNPGDHVESRVAAPGANLTAFNEETQTELNARYGRIFVATDAEPFPVNHSETNVFLGNINYAPYAACN